jgi:dTDP-glucose 4,6-dehydratase
MVLITGGAGFIGANVVHHWIDRTTETVINVDKLTYAGNLQNLVGLDSNPRHIFHRSDIGDVPEISHILRKYCPKVVLNLAAESHVDRSIQNPAAFIETNVVATLRFLETVRDYWTDLATAERAKFRFIHISTDEVYGSLGPDDAPFNESASYAPNNLYAASKAASDHLVRAFHRTFGLPVITTNCSNNYGPYQFPEKLIPLMINRALADESLPVYGDGQNVRDWIYVTDHCAAIRTAAKKGQPGEVYNIGSSNERTNLDVVNQICEILDQTQPRQDGKSYRKQIEFVNDRPGHDRRYSIESKKIRSLGWEPKETFEQGIRATVLWYLENRKWSADVTSGAYKQWIDRQYGKNSNSP